LAHILVIDDDDLIRSTIRRTLEAVGHTIGEARNGRVGVAEYRKYPADLIISDILMPEQEGLETILQFRREFPKAVIIAISGGGTYGNLNFLETAKQFGAAGTLAKPFFRHELLEVVNKLLLKEEKGEG